MAKAHNKTKHQIGLILIISVSCLLISGCACLNPDNTRLLNAFEEHVVPEEGSTAKKITYPLTMPAGLICVLLDTTIIHPACSIDDAFYLTLDILDTPKKKWNEQYVSQCALLPWKTAVSPACFTLSWLTVSFIDLDNLFRDTNRRKPRKSAKQTNESLAEQKKKQLKYELVQKLRNRMGAAYLHNFFKREQDAEIKIILFEKTNLKTIAPTKVSAKRLIQTLATDSKGIIVPSAADFQKLEPILWITINGQLSSMIIALDKEGFSSGSDVYRFASPYLAKWLENQLSNHGILDRSTQNAPLYKNAIKAGRENFVSLEQAIQIKEAQANKTSKAE